MSGVHRKQDPFRWRSTVLFIAIAMAVSLLLRQIRLAGGIALGLALYVSNLLLLMEIGRSLLRGVEGRRAKPIAALSSAGRLIFLGIALALIAVFLGREVVLGACGGLLIAQVNLHIPKRGMMEMGDE